MDIIEVDSVIHNRHPWEVCRFKIINEIIEKDLPSTGIKWILDVGCGDAYFVERLLQLREDINIIAIDPAYTQNQIARKEGSINNSRFHLLRQVHEVKKLIGDHPVDLVLLLDVIEHIKDDVAFLKDIMQNKFIHDRTKFLVTVPAFQELYSRHDSFLKHYRRYNKNTLIQSLQSANLYPIKTGYFFISLLVIRLLQKTFEKVGIFCQEKGVGAWKGKKSITSIIITTLLTDYKISKLLSKIGIHLPGLSLYSLCIKRAS